MTTSIIFWPLRLRKIVIDNIAVIAAPTLTSKPKMAFSPKQAPAILPILNANPPMAIKMDINVPSPLNISLATS